MIKYRLHPQRRMMLSYKPKVFWYVAGRRMFERGVPEQVRRMRQLGRYGSPLLVLNNIKAQKYHRIISRAQR